MKRTIPAFRLPALALMLALVGGNMALAAAGTSVKSTGTPVKSTSEPKYDTKLPIEISSDTLEVLQHDNKAIFRGNVVAVQGKIRLKSDTMIVHYKQHSDQPGGSANAPATPAATITTGKTDATSAAPSDTPPAAAGNAAAGAMGAITHIEVEGNVFVATPEESAKGDNGDYHVDTHMLHLFGKNVTLTREKNILRGTALEYNLETGRSLLTNNNGGVVTGNTTDGRVRGVFVPNETPKPGASQKPAQPQ